MPFVFLFFTFCSTHICEPLFKISSHIEYTIRPLYRVREKGPLLPNAIKIFAGERQSERFIIRLNVRLMKRPIPPLSVFFSSSVVASSDHVSVTTGFWKSNTHEANYLGRQWRWQSTGRNRTNGSQPGTDLNSRWWHCYEFVKVAYLVGISSETPQIAEYCKK